MQGVEYKRGKRHHGALKKVAVLRQDPTAAAAGPKGYSCAGTTYTLPRSTIMSLRPTSCLALRLLSCSGAPFCCLAAGRPSGLALVPPQPPASRCSCRSGCCRRCTCCRQGSSRNACAQQPSLSCRRARENHARPCTPPPPSAASVSSGGAPPGAAAAAAAACARRACRLLCCA